MNQLIVVITNPIVYAGALGILVAYYVIWSLARQQYLGVDKLFNLLALSIAAGWFFSWLYQSIINQVWESPLGISQLWVNPQPITALVGYIGIWLVATRYIRSIRYPHWRLMDMLFVSLAIVQSALLAGWAIEQFSWLLVALAILYMAVTVGLFFLYRILQRSGIVSGLQSAIFFGLLLALHLMVPTWQEQIGGVEWVADTVGILLGIILVILRVSAKSEKVLLQDIPRGVSQSFQETFTRAFNKKSAENQADK